MNQQATTVQNNNCHTENIEIEDVQADETANNEKLQTDCKSTVSVAETKPLEESKLLKICRLFVTWPKLFLGE